MLDGGRRRPMMCGVMLPTQLTSHGRHGTMAAVMVTATLQMGMAAMEAMLQGMAAMEATLQMEMAGMVTATLQMGMTAMEAMLQMGWRPWRAMLQVMAVLRQ